MEWNKTNAYVELVIQSVVTPRRASVSYITMKLNERTTKNITPRNICLIINVL